MGIPLETPFQFFKPESNARPPMQINDAFGSTTYYSKKFSNRFYSTYQKRNTAETRFYVEEVTFG